MPEDFTFHSIGEIQSCYPQKFGIPRQSGLSPSAHSKIRILAPYNRLEAFEELEGSSHIWVQFVFHANTRIEWKPKVKAPRLGGNKSIGVFSTRSPVRPNPIGLSAVKLEAIHYKNGELMLEISGGDFLDGTPVLDIKPYVPYCDRIPEASNRFAAQPPEKVAVHLNKNVEEFLTQSQNTHLKPLLLETLALNPAPQYQSGTNKKHFVCRLLQYDFTWAFTAAGDIEVSKVECV